MNRARLRITAASRCGSDAHLPRQILLPSHVDDSPHEAPHDVPGINPCDGALQRPRPSTAVNQPHMASAVSESAPAVGGVERIDRRDRVIPRRG